MKGMFQKILGITGSIIVLGIIVMVAISPRGEGFFPELLSFRKAAEQQPVPVSVPPAVPEPEPAPMPLPADSLLQPLADTLPGE